MSPPPTPPRLRDALDGQGRLVGPVKRPLGHLGDDRCVGEGTRLEVDGILEEPKVREEPMCLATSTYGCRNISTGDTLDRCIEIIEGFALDDLCTDLATDTEGREATFDDDETALRVNKSGQCYPEIGRTG